MKSIKEARAELARLEKMPSDLDILNRIEELHHFISMREYQLELRKNAQDPFKKYGDEIDRVQQNWLDVGAVMRHGSEGRGSIWSYDGQDFFSVYGDMNITEYVRRLRLADERLKGLMMEEAQA